MNSVPGFSFSYIHLMPLKNTISISPLPSLTHTLILLTPFVRTSSPIFPPKRSIFITVARICTKAMSGLASAILTKELLSIYLKGYTLRSSPTVLTPSSFRNSSALFGPTPGRNCTSISDPERPISQKNYILPPGTSHLVSTMLYLRSVYAPSALRLCSVCKYIPHMCQTKAKLNKILHIPNSPPCMLRQYRNNDSRRKPHTHANPPLPALLKETHIISKEFCKFVGFRIIT